MQPQRFEIDNHRLVSVVDDDFDVWYRSTPKAKVDLLEPDGDCYTEVNERQRAALAAALNTEHFVLPPRDIEITPRRRPPDGHSSVGIGVLSTEGRVVSADEDVVTLRLDSGASISLVAEEYLKGLKAPPKIRSGLRIEIAQLTDQSPRIKGYVRLPVRIPAEGGGTLVLHAELYVVPNMTVPILLGEDFQLNYELEVLRNVELGTRVKVGATGYSFSASSTTSSASELGREASRLAPADGALHAWEDVLIPPETTKRVRVAGDLQQGREWYVERFLVPQPDETFLTIPNTLLDLRTTEAGRREPGSIARCSLLPVSNPTKVPRILRAGTLLGYARDPQTSLDHPSSTRELQSMTQAAEVLS
ncbi:hypothetical protein AURDEDRAFT_69361, partial [Auricularia subglabra TFB-10046 SS5]